MKILKIALLSFGINYGIQASSGLDINFVLETFSHLDSATMEYAFNTLDRPLLVDRFIQLIKNLEIEEEVKNLEIEEEARKFFVNLLCKDLDTFYQTASLNRDFGP
jgi:hypothetical protein